MKQFRSIEHLDTAILYNQVLQTAEQNVVSGVLLVHLHCEWQKLSTEPLIDAFAEQTG